MRMEKDAAAAANGVSDECEMGWFGLGWMRRWIENMPKTAGMHDANESLRTHIEWKAKRKHKSMLFIPR